MICDKTFRKIPNYILHSGKKLMQVSAAAIRSEVDCYLTNALKCVVSHDKNNPFCIDQRISIV
jgi:hypothetical protein